MRTRDDTLLNEDRLVQRRLQARKRADRLIQRLLVLELLDLFVGIAHHDEHGARCHRNARPDGQQFDTATGQRGHVAHVLWLERPRSVDVTRHRTALDGIDPQRAALHRRGGRLQSADRHRYGDDGEQAKG